MPSDNASVYGLKDTLVFYIGISTDPYARYGQHITLASKGKTAKDKRVLDMRKDGLMPELIIFEQGLSVERASIREKFWIQYHLDLGIVLTNVHHLTVQLPKSGKAGRASSELDYALKWIPWADAGFPIKNSPFRNPYEMRKHVPKLEVEIQARAILDSQKVES